jgi:hypothetical protein
MGLRGPKPLPPEIKALKGNPGKRRLVLDAATGGVVTHPRRLVAEPPRYLTEQAERDAFVMALATLPANVARASDVNAVARWACWLNIWVQCKFTLSGETNHDLKFHHKRMSDAEQHLTRLEDRLGLNVAARNSIVHRLFQMPHAQVVVEALDGEPVQAAPQKPGEASGGNGSNARPLHDDKSPLGWLRRHAKPHSH